MQSSLRIVLTCYLIFTLLQRIVFVIMIFFFAWWHMVMCHSFSRWHLKRFECSRVKRWSNKNCHYIANYFSWERIIELSSYLSAAILEHHKLSLLIGPLRQTLGWPLSGNVYYGGVCNDKYGQRNTPCVWSKQLHTVIEELGNKLANYLVNFWITNLSITRGIVQQKLPEHNGLVHEEWHKCWWHKC